MIQIKGKRRISDMHSIQAHSLIFRQPPKDAFYLAKKMLPSKERCEGKEIKRILKMVEGDPRGR